jgi:hypothetical protein
MGMSEKEALARLGGVLLVGWALGVAVDLFLVFKEDGLPVGDELRGLLEKEGARRRASALSTFAFNSSVSATSASTFVKGPKVTAGVFEIFVILVFMPVLC